MSRKSRSSTSYYRDHPLLLGKDKVRGDSKHQESEQLVYLPVCSRCGKSRRPRTHIDVVDPLDQIICRRPACERLKGLVKDILKLDNLVINVNHYHYGESLPKAVPQNKVAELPEGSSATGRIELPGELAKCEYFGTERPRRLRTILEEPPRVDLSTKPTMAELMYVMQRKNRGT
ncbi:hypothetical protein GQ44DRAFT_152098 [Phaeosphaeriaceae sp. PMI808]|nr:hypothetical protein GQ44DRAFT_152098 [Phaeosphaeriaceae sp. PMI808]